MSRCAISEVVIPRLHRLGEFATLCHQGFVLAENLRIDSFDDCVWPPRITHEYALCFSAVSTLARPPRLRQGLFFNLLRCLVPDCELLRGRMFSSPVRGQTADDCAIRATLRRSPCARRSQPAGRSRHSFRTRGGRFSHATRGSFR